MQVMLERESSKKLSDRIVIDDVYLGDECRVGSEIEVVQKIYLS